MKLHYFSGAPNFGDALNPWLWPQLLGSRLDEDPTRLFLGIGSILNTALPEAKSYHVLGSGGGYGSFPVLDDRWHIYGVRGPLTARALGLPSEVAITDSAALLRTVPLPAPRPGPAIGFMPHYWALRRVPWRSLCARLGLRYVDPLAPALEVLADIRGCDCLIAEALHGAIVADSCRVPWVPVVTGKHVNDFKWRDWLASLEMEAPRRRLAMLSRPTLHRPTDNAPIRFARRSVNGLAFAVGMAELTYNLRQLSRRLLSRRQEPWLSRDAVLQERTDRLRRQLDRLRDDIDRAGSADHAAVAPS